MLGKLPVSSGRPTNLDYSRQGPIVLTVGAGGGLHILSLIFGWLVVLGLTALYDSISVYIGPSPREGKRKEKR